jgi:hypothetical protein
MKIENDDYFELSGSIERGIKYSLKSKDDSVSHICVNCFIKHFNLMVPTTREPLNIEKQGDILKRKIEDKPYTQQPRPFIHEEIRYEKPWDITCTGPTKTDSMVIGAVDELTKLTDSDSYQICAGKTCVTIPSKDNPYPIR